MSLAEPKPPAFMSVMPKIGGSAVCVVPFAQSRLKLLKDQAAVDIPDDLFVSTDDVLTALVWKSLCAMRCSQVGVAVDSSELTTVARACQFRQKTNPPLGSGFCGNGVAQVFCEMSVRELLESSTQAVALNLRERLKGFTSESVGAGAKWLSEQQEAGNKVFPEFDAKGLTFVISSWGFNWQGVDFNAQPVAFDHGALVPIVSNIVPRPAGDGVNVYASGPQQSLELFANLITQ